MNLHDIGWPFRAFAVDILTLGERWKYGVNYNPLSARMIADPYPFYDRIRNGGRVHVSRLLNNSLLFAHHADVNTVARSDTMFFRDLAKVGKDDERSRPENRNLLNIDPPEHTRLRKLVVKAFTPRMLKDIEPHIRRGANELLDAIDDPADFDFMESFAVPLPIHAISVMLGVPKEDHDQFKDWTLKRAPMIEPLISAAQRKAAEQAARELDAYFKPVIRDRRDEPRDDIVSALAQAEDEGDKLNEQEMLNMLRLVLGAGSETTINLLGNGLLALLRHPEQERALRDDPGLIPGAIEEMLRYDSPAQVSYRFAIEDCEINGIAVKEKQPCILLVGAANRDPEAFPDPERFDILRKSDAGVMSFGGGIHYCLGAALARLEARIGFETLFERFSSLRLLVERPRFRRTITLRGVQSLPLCAVPA